MPLDHRPAFARLTYFPFSHYSLLISGCFFFVRFACVCDLLAIVLQCITAAAGSTAMGIFPFVGV